MHVILRLEQNYHVCRLHSARVAEGERFYLRRLLQHRPSRSFDELRIVGGQLHATFQEAAVASGLFDDEHEAEYAMTEAIQALYTPRQIRILLVDLLINDCISSPVAFWNRFRDRLCLDYTLRTGNNPIAGQHGALREMSGFLAEHGKTLVDFGLPDVQTRGREVEHELLQWGADPRQLAQRASDAFQNLTHEQAAIFDEIVTAVQYQQPLYLFVDGKAGRGKTFLMNTLADHLRSHGLIILPTAIAAFAAQLYRGGRTTHSTFKVIAVLPTSVEFMLIDAYIQVPVNSNNEFLKSPINANDTRAELIREAAVILIDETPMGNRAVFSCVDEVCRLVMGNDLPFGGKIVILLGDFRQTCPVIRGGSRAQVIDASIKSSPLWNIFQIRHLTIPIRNAEDPDFAAYVDAIGDGAGPQVPLRMLESCTEPEDLIAFTFPGDILRHPEKCVSRSILAPTNAQVDSYNDTILRRLPGTAQSYFASDSLKEADDAGLDDAEVVPDAILHWVASHTIHGIPAHTLRLKRGCVCRILRNMSITRGLVKNARVVVDDVGYRLVSVRLLRPNTHGAIVAVGPSILLPRIPFTQTLSSGHTLLRRQYPLGLAYCTTFNSCQGLTLDKVGVDGTIPVFSHGQLYTALSRIRRREDGLVRLLPGESNLLNVTFLEILI